MKFSTRHALVGPTLVVALFSWGCQQSTPTSTTTEHTQMSQESPASHPMKMGEKGMATLKSLEGKEFDIAFLSQMIAHHQAALDMANEALKVAAKPQTREEAQKVIEAQTQEMKQMNSWLKDWYGTVPDAGQQAIVREDMKDMMAMRISNDRAFFEMMIPHHEGAIAMSELADSRASKPELKDLARKIVADQQAEIKKYQALKEVEH